MSDRVFAIGCFWALLQILIQALRYFFPELWAQHLMELLLLCTIIQPALLCFMLPHKCRFPGAGSAVACLYFALWSAWTIPVCNGLLRPEAAAQWANLGPETVLEWVILCYSYVSGVIPIWYWTFTYHESNNFYPLTRARARAEAEKKASAGG